MNQTHLRLKFECPSASAALCCRITLSLSFQCLSLGLLVVEGFCFRLTLLVMPVLPYLRASIRRVQGRNNGTLTWRTLSQNFGISSSPFSANSKKPIGLAGPIVSVVSHEPSFFWYRFHRLGRPGYMWVSQSVCGQSLYV